MRKTYSRKYFSCERLYISVDLTDAAAPIFMSWDGPENFRNTPFQTADVWHSLTEAFRRCKNYEY